MSEDTETSKPIWHSPAWITAIVGVVSAFLTVPEVVGNFLSQQQAIELAREQTKAQSLLNEGSKQDQELNILRETLAQPPGLERVFVLRYLSRTLDDDDARTWAEDEVARLDRIAQAEENKEQTDAALRELREELNTQSTDAEAEAVDALRKELDRQNAELQRLLREAGVSVNIVGTQSFEVETSRELSRVILVATPNMPLDQLRNLAVNSRGWSDIGEHFVVRRDGQVEAGRPLSRSPAVAAGANTGTVGIGIPCDFVKIQQDQSVCDIEPAQYEALLDLISELMLENGISADRVFDVPELPNSRPKYDYLGDLTERLRADLAVRLAPR